MPIRELSHNWSQINGARSAPLSSSHLSERDETGGAEREFARRENWDFDFRELVPESVTLQRNGAYLRLANFPEHPLADRRHYIPVHRFVLFEALKRPDVSKCRWCSYVLPWKTSLGGGRLHVINVDHLDGFKTHNRAVNLESSCWWCNANRSWAEAFPDFWQQWRRWMKDVPPWSRPNLASIAQELGIKIDWKEESV